jgi:hypothetical protein
MAPRQRTIPRRPEAGCLGYTQGRSFEHLEAYARAKDREHWPAWGDFNRNVKSSSGDVGIWRETYRVHACEYEAIYGSMPTFGLGKVGTLVPAAGKKDSARGRIAGVAADTAQAFPQVEDVAPMH